VERARSRPRDLTEAGVAEVIDEALRSAGASHRETWDSPGRAHSSGSSPGSASRDPSTSGATRIWGRSSPEMSPPALPFWA